jgi:voltage-gated potassium channel
MTRVSFVDSDAPRQQPSARDQELLAAWDRHSHLAIVLAAILPIVLGLSRASEDSGITITVNVVAWLVFVADLGVRVKLVPGYLKSRVGVFDLTIVVVTAPWFLIPGLGGSQVLMLARLGRLARLLVASPGARKALQRLGQVGFFATAMLLLATWMAYTAERETNPGFETYADSRGGASSRSRPSATATSSRTPRRVASPACS